MPQIDAIRFRKYKSFGEEYSTIPLKRMTVLIGRNNSGKSSCIDVIEALSNAQVLRDLMKQICIVRKLTDEDIKTAIGGYQLSPLELAKYKRSQMIVNVSTISTPSRNGTSYHHDLQALPDEKIFPIRDFDWHYLEKELENILESVISYRVNAERDILPEASESSTSLSVNGDGATNLINQVLTNSSYEESLVQDSLLNALNEIMFPDAKYSGITVQRVEDEKWEVFLYENGERHPLSKTGSGLKTIILVLLNLLVVPEMLKKQNPTIKKEITVYAFEELENNLHPALQRRLFDYINRYSKEHSNTYVFLTTHSHVPINMFADQEDAQILHVTKENGVSTIQNVNDFITKSEVLYDLDVRASDLLQSNGIIWVEGPSDRVYIKRWMEIWGGDDMREGIDYQFLYYGGRLLSHYSADESQEDSELISILTTNRNSAIVIDSDKTSPSKPINDTKKRIQAVFDRLNLFCWITKGKEIENYVPCQAINDSYGCELAQCGKYELFPEYIKGIRPYFSNEKVRFASKLIDHINADNSDSILDLKKQILELIKTVRGWTPDKQSAQT